MQNMALQIDAAVGLAAPGPFGFGWGAMLTRHLRSRRDHISFGLAKMSHIAQCRL
jgi:hypothetical protein